MADDDLSDLSDMSGLANEPARIPTPRPARPDDLPPPPPAPTGTRVAGQPAGRSRPEGSGCGPAMVVLGAIVALAVVGLVLGLVLVAADDGTGEGPDGAPAVETTERTGEQIDPPDTTAPTDLYQGGLASAFDDLLTAAGNPAEILELVVYDTYAILAYRDPAAPANIDRRIWRDGQAGDADANPIDDRADEATIPALFPPADVDPAVVAQAIADAPGRYPMPVEVTHVIIDRFLPFDERVLIRVYATPADGRSGGGYVTYDLTGTYVDICC